MNDSEPRGARWSFRILGTIVVVLAISCCVAAGVLATRTTHVPASRTAAAQAKRARVHARVIAAKRRVVLARGLSFAPPSGSTAVAPDTPIVVTAASGRISDVSVTSTAALAPARSFHWSDSEWRSESALAYGAEYHVTATVSGPANVTVKETATFRTLEPTATVSVSVFPNSGLTLGVGQPVAFRFSRGITTAAARAAVLQHLTISESVPVAGGWHWFSDRELHFRPAKFWPVGEHVDVAWNLTGWHADNGVWGDGSGTSTFAIGHSRVSFANLATHLMTVTENGRIIATYPISGGKATDPTMGGVHIVLDRQSVVRMNSATNGVPVNSPDGYDELVYKDVHISDTGEYVHAAPWSVSSQGRANVSHGCINLSMENATAYFAFSRVGDVVVVTGSPRPPVTGDHGVMDWDTPLSQWTPVKAANPPSGA